MRKVLRTPAQHALCDVIALERATFPEPWISDDFEWLLEHGGEVFEFRGQKTNTLIGYATVEPTKQGIRLHTIAVAKKWRRRGVGRAIVSTIMDPMKPDQRITAYVAERNLDAQLFFRAVGFRCVRVRGDYFDDGQDALIFQGSPETQK